LNATSISVTWPTQPTTLKNPRRTSLSADELDAATGGGAIVQAMQCARDVGASRTTPREPTAADEWANTIMEGTGG
jgi:hypothetical protein